MRHFTTWSAMVLAVLALAPRGVLHAAPSGWGNDYESARVMVANSGYCAVVAVLDTENSFACRAWKRDTIDGADNRDAWRDWRADHVANPRLVWCDRAEMDAKKWSAVAFLFSGGANPGGGSDPDDDDDDDEGGGAGGDPGGGASVTLPLIFMLTPDGRAVRAGNISAITGFDEFTDWIGDVMEPWEGMPLGALRWPAAVSGVGKVRQWSLDYQGTRDRAFNSRLPVLLAIVDSNSTMAGATWCRGTLMAPEWREWLADVNLHLILWDRARIGRSKWDDVAFRFAGGGSLSLPQIILFDGNGSKVDQFAPVNGADANLALAGEFIERIEESLDDMEGVFTGPGTIGFASGGISVGVGALSVPVEVRRLSGDGQGAQSFQLRTHDGPGATNNLHYVPVSTNLIWSAGDMGSKVVEIPLLLTNAFDTATSRVFAVTLEKLPGSTAKIGTTNLNVAIVNNFTAGANWKYDESEQLWRYQDETSLLPMPGKLEWSAPQAGLLTFQHQLGSTNDTLEASVPVGAAFTNVTALPLQSPTNYTVALTAGAKVTWTATGTNGTQEVHLQQWYPVVQPEPLAPLNGSSFTTNEIDSVKLVWTAPESGVGITNLLEYGSDSKALAGTATNALSPKLAAELGLTNSVNYWRLQTLLRGDLGTIVVLTAPLWHFKVGPPAPPPPLSMTITAYKNLPLALPLGVGGGMVVSGLPPGMTFDPASGMLTGAPRKAGTYQIKATAAGGLMPPLTLLTLTVAARLPDYLTGVFEGILLDEAGGIAGTLTLKISSSGRPTLQLTDLTGRKQSLKGLWRGTQPHGLRFTTRSGEVFEFSLDAYGVSIAGFDALIERVQSQGSFAGGYYTLLMEAETLESGALQNAPEGHGFLSFTVGARNGRARYAGRLPDGARISGSAWLLPGSTPGTALFALARPLYAKRGGVATLVRLEDGVATLEAGAWHYPGLNRRLVEDRFSALLTGGGAAYAKPVDLAGYDGADFLAAGEAASLQLLKGRLGVQPGSAFKLSVRPATGLFSGTLYDHDGKRRRLQGILTPMHGVGGGYWLWPDLEGEARLHKLKRSLPVVIKGE